MICIYCLIRYVARNDVDMVVSVYHLIRLWASSQKLGDWGTLSMYWCSFLLWHDCDEDNLVVDSVFKVTDVIPCLSYFVWLCYTTFQPPFIITLSSCHFRCKSGEDGIVNRGESVGPLASLICCVHWSPMYLTIITPFHQSIMGMTTRLSFWSRQQSLSKPLMSVEIWVVKNNRTK